MCIGHSALEETFLDIDGGINVDVPLALMFALAAMVNNARLRRRQLRS